MAGGGLEEELKRRLKLTVEAQGVSGSSFGEPTCPPGCPTHNCQMVDFFFSWTDGCSRDALQGRQEKELVSLLASLAWDSIRQSWHLYNPLQKAVKVRLHSVI